MAGIIAGDGMMWKIMGIEKKAAVTPTDTVLAATFIEGMKADVIVDMKSAVNYVNKKHGTYLSIGDIKSVYETVLDEAISYKKSKKTTNNKYVKATDFEV